MQQNIINRLTEVFKNEPSIHAVWLEGSWAEGLNDELSDIDMWADIDDGQEKAIFELAEKTLSEFGDVSETFQEDINHPYLRAKDFYIKGMSPYQSVTIDTQYHSRNFLLPKVYTL